MNFYKFINEGHEPMFKFPYKNVKIFWNTGKAGEDHSMDSRLKRIDMTKSQVYEYIKKFIALLKKENKLYGIYAVVFPTFKMIATYSKNRIFINTFLTRNMIEKDYDFHVQIAEALESFYGEKIEKNTFAIVKILEESVGIEKGEEYIDFIGMNNSVFEIIEIN